MNDSPKVDYPTLLGRTFGLHTSYATGVLTREQFESQAQDIRNDFEKQATASRIYWTAEFDSAIAGEAK